MTARARGAILLAVQLALVLSIAAKFAWERHACPMVWTRAYQIDPELPLRGRYLALTITANACGLPAGSTDQQYGLNSRHEWGPIQAQSWRVHTVARNGQLTLVPAPEDDTQNAQEALLLKDTACETARLQQTIDFFLSEKAKPPVLKAGETMWVLVTVPPSGPPRPVKLAISDARSFRPLDFK